MVEGTPFSETADAVPGPHGSSLPELLVKTCSTLLGLEPSGTVEL